MPVPHIACAIDVNDFDPHVIDVAASFARELGTELDLIHVTLYPDPSGAAWPAYLGSPDAVIQENRKLKALDLNDDGITINRHHLSGIPDEKVLGFVDRNQPQLLVVGSHVRTPVARFFLGSIASKILRRAMCPVMIIKMRTGEPSQKSDKQSDQLAKETPS